MVTEEDREKVKEEAINKLTSNLVFYLGDGDRTTSFAADKIDTLERDVRKSVEQLYDAILFEVHQMITVDHAPDPEGWTSLKNLTGLEDRGWNND